MFPADPACEGLLKVPPPKILAHKRSAPLPLLSRPFKAAGPEEYEAEVSRQESSFPLQKAKRWKGGQGGQDLRVQ